MAGRKFMRGAKPSPRSRLAAAIPHAIVGVTPPLLIYKPAQLSVWGNDVNGDCTVAEEAFAKACYSPEIFITDNEVITWAQANNAINGAIIHDVLLKMATSGFQQAGITYDDGNASSVDWTNAGLLQNAIAQGPVKIGVAANQLETAFNQYNQTSGWIATGFNQDSAEDHCVSLCGYGPISWLAQKLGVAVPSGINGSVAAYAMFTWGTIGIIDEPSMLAITSEAWLRNPTTYTPSTSRIVN